MLDYSAFFLTLAEKEVRQSQLIKAGVVRKDIIHRMRHNKNIELKHIDSICCYLDVPIEKVVQIKR